MSTSCAFKRPTVNFRQFPSRQKSFHKFLSTFQAGKRPSVNFLQLSLWPETFRQISVWPQDLSSASIKCPCGRVTFCKFVLNFPAVRKRCVNFHLAWRLCVNFCQLFVRPVDFPSLPSTLGAAKIFSDNFHDISVLPGNVASISIWPGELPSTSVNFPYHRETFRQLLCNFCTVRRPSINIPSNCVNFRHLPSTFLNFLCGGRPSVNFTSSRETFIQLPSTFRAAGISSINFRQFSVLPEGLP